MVTHPRIATVSISLAVCMLLQPSSWAASNDWPGFRGHNATGVAEGPTPTNWNAEDGTNIAWKTPIPGLAHSSPIVWGDRVYVTTAINTEGEASLRVGLYGDIKPVDEAVVHHWKLYCLDKRTGEIVWEKTAHTGIPRIPRHTKATHANSTPVTNGKYVLAWFGSEGLYCYDMDGELIWKKDLGLLDSGFYMSKKALWGFAGSPIIHEDRVIVQCDVLSDAFIAALDLETGEEVWRTQREEVPTWSTPSIYQSSEGVTRIAVNGFKHIGGYDFATGEEVWRLRGGGDIPTPTPVIAHNLILIANAHGRLAPIYAINRDATGDISLGDDERSNDAIAWSVRRGGAYMQTPLVYGEYLYNCQDNGRLSVFDAKSGERAYAEKIGDVGMGFSASPVAADGKIYFSSEPGDIFVLKTGSEFEVIARNPMGEICMATPAISESTLFFRTRHHLVAVAEKEIAIAISYSQDNTYIELEVIGVVLGDIPGMTNPG